MAYDVERALKDGVPEEEIARYLSNTRNYRFDEAVKAGVSHREIIDYLSPQKSIEKKPRITEPVLPKKEQPLSPLFEEKPPVTLTPPGLAKPVVPREIKEPVIPPSIDLSGFPKESIPSHKPVKPNLGAPAAEPSKDFGLRPDGTPKGSGFLGVLPRPDGEVSTEISVGVNINGQEVEIPSLVPTLDQAERDYLLNTPLSPEMWKTPIGQQIMAKAVEHAKGRMAEGKSPFAQEGEQVTAKVSETKPSIPGPATIVPPFVARHPYLAAIPETIKEMPSELKGLFYGEPKISPKEGLYDIPKKSLLEKIPEIVVEQIPFREQIIGTKEWRTPETGMEAGALVVGGKFLGEAGIAFKRGFPKVAEFFTKPISKIITDSGWYRSLTIKERGLTTQSLDDMLNKGYSEADVLRRWNNPSWREEALRRRNKGEEFPPFAEAGKTAEPTGPRVTPPGMAPEGPEPIGSTIPAPGTPPPRPTPAPPLGTVEPTGTIMPMGIPLTAPSPESVVPIEAPQPIPSVGVAPITPPPQPKPIETPAPTAPIPQMMGMGQPTLPPLPEAKPAIDTEFASKVKILQENTDRLLQEGGYQVAKQQPKSKKGEDALYKRGYKPMLWDETTGDLQLNILGVWVKESAKPVVATPKPPKENIIREIARRDMEKAAKLPSEEFPVLETKVEALKPEGGTPPLIEQKGYFPAEQWWEKTPQERAGAWDDMYARYQASKEEAKPDLDKLREEYKSLKGKGSQVSKKAIKDKIDTLQASYEIIPAQAESNLIDESIKHKEAVEVEARKAGVPEADFENFITDYDLSTSNELPYYEQNYNKTNRQIFNEMLEEYGFLPPTEPQIEAQGVETVRHGLSYEEWSKDPALVKDAEVAAEEAGVELKDLEYIGLQSLKPTDTYHLWNVTNPESPLYKSTVSGPKFERKEISRKEVKEGKKAIEPPSLQTSATIAVPPTSQHLELMPEEYPDIEAAAIKQDGKIYKDHTHISIALENNLDPEKAIPGFVTKRGEFIEQYPGEKEKGKKPVEELKSLGYDDKQIGRMKPDVVRGIVDAQTPASEVSITQDGEVVKIGKGQATVSQTSGGLKIGQTVKHNKTSEIARIDKIYQNGAVDVTFLETKTERGELVGENKWHFTPTKEFPSFDKLFSLVSPEVQKAAVAPLPPMLPPGVGVAVTIPKPLKKKGGAVENKPLIGTYGTEGAKVEEEGDSRAADRNFGRDLRRFAKELQKNLGWEEDPKHKLSSINIAPIGGDGTILMWKPNSEFGLYVSVPVQRNYEDGSLKIGEGVSKDILWRWTTKKNPWRGFGNQYAKKAVTPKELADLVRSQDAQVTGEEAEKITPEAPEEKKVAPVTPLPPGIGTKETVPEVKKEPVPAPGVKISEVAKGPITKISPSEFEEAPEKFIPDDMIIEVKAIREKTGKEITIKQNAKEAFLESSERLKRFRDFLDCIKS